jgi:hypothetical protein
VLEGTKVDMWRTAADRRREFIGGYDAGIIIGEDEVALDRLWHVKRGTLTLCRGGSVCTPSLCAGAASFADPTEASHGRG